MPKIITNKFNTYYELHGNGKKTLVLISGLKGDHLAWSSVIGALSEQYKVLVFDNRGVGQGDSTGDNYSIEQMSDDVMSLLDTLQIKDPIIVGHSLGGAIAQYIAMKHGDQIDQLILCNTFAKFNDASCKIFEDIIPLHENNSKPSIILNSFISDVISEEFLEKNAMREVILEFVDTVKHPQTADGYKGQVAALNAFDSRSWLNKITVPTLVIHAQSDNIVSQDDANYLVNGINNAELNIISGGHASQVEQPHILCSLITEFINKA